MASARTPPADPAAPVFTPPLLRLSPSFPLPFFLSAPGLDVAHGRFLAASLFRFSIPEPPSLPSSRASRPYQLSSPSTPAAISDFSRSFAPPVALRRPSPPVPGPSRDGFRILPRRWFMNRDPAAPGPAGGAGTGWRRRGPAPPDHGWRPPRPTAFARQWSRQAMILPGGPRSSTGGFFFEFAAMSRPARRVGSGKPGKRRSGARRLGQERLAKVSGRANEAGGGIEVRRDGGVAAES